ncbi:MAG: thioredoxin 1 [Gammaproteobacteria bacterium]|jgi:thioredoxin 1
MAEAHTLKSNSASNFVDSDTNESKEAIQQGGLVMLDFWSTHCGPCKSLIPLLNEIAEKYPELSILKVKIEENDNLAEEHDVRSVPALLLFKEGKYLDRLMGKSPFPMIDNFIKKHK